jgi:Flp pilus assembly protein TadB
MEPLFDESLGRMLLISGAVMMMVGFVVIRRMADQESESRGRGRGNDDDLASSWVWSPSRSPCSCWEWPGSSRIRRPGWSAVGSRRSRGRAKERRGASDEATHGQRESLEAFLEAFGRRVGGQRPAQGRQGPARARRIPASQRRRVYMGARVALAGGLRVHGGRPGASFLGGPRSSSCSCSGGLLGWMLPFVSVRGRKRRQRQDEVQRDLPDALDLMVVSVEAGLGLNQALVRVGEEMDRVSPACRRSSRS